VFRKVEQPLVPTSKLCSDRQHNEVCMYISKEINKYIYLFIYIFISLIYDNSVNSKCIIFRERLSDCFEVL
jgi:hypothetical protein